MERLKAELGQAVFLNLVDGGSEGFGRGLHDRVAAAAATPAGTAR